jgi:hypothetical protein
VWKPVISQTRALFAVICKRESEHVVIAVFGALSLRGRRGTGANQAGLSPLAVVPLRSALRRSALASQMLTTTAVKAATASEMVPHPVR